MKCRIITAEKETKTCLKCKGQLWRKSTRSKYTNKERTEGRTYELTICDNCGYREEYNKITWQN